MPFNLAFFACSGRRNLDLLVLSVQGATKSPQESLWRTRWSPERPADVARFIFSPKNRSSSPMMSSCERSCHTRTPTSKDGSTANSHIREGSFVCPHNRTSAHNNDERTVVPYTSCNLTFPRSFGLVRKHSNRQPAAVHRCAAVTVQCDADETASAQKGTGYSLPSLIVAAAVCQIKNPHSDPYNTSSRRLHQRSNQRWRARSSSISASYAFSCKCHIVVHQPIWFWHLE